MKTVQTTIKLLMSLFFLVSVFTFAGNSKYFTTKKNIALKGYDVVAYFKQNKAVKGSSEFKMKHDGVIFQFSSKENKDAFKAEPSKYLPKFGGYCAFAMAVGNGKVPVDPETFKLYNGELLLFFNDMYQGKKMNTSVMWNQAEKNNYKKAGKNWQKVD